MALSYILIISNKGGVHLVPYQVG